MCLLLVGSQTHAADHGITGKKLLMTTTRYVVLSKDTDNIVDVRFVVPAPDRFVSFGANSYSLPDGYWSTHATNSIFKYKNPLAPDPSPVKIVRVKNGLLKVVAKGSSLPVPIGDATINVVLNLGFERYCMTFTGTGDGNKFLVKFADQGSCPPPPAACADSGYPTCGGSCPSGQVCQAIVQGFCNFQVCDFCLAAQECSCVAENATCAGLSSPGGGCFAAGNTPFTFGVCPPGDACVDVKVFMDDNPDIFEERRQCQGAPP
jgi:hypothetical protein